LNSLSGPDCRASASEASGEELIERLRAIAVDYKRFLFNDNSP
jgi:hypothetical protein